MTGSYERLVAHLRAQRRRLFLAVAAAADWGDVRLTLDLAGAEYAALPFPDAGWGVLTPDLLGGRALDVSACWDAVLAGYVGTHGPAGIALSEGWAAGADARRRPAGR
jgi:hypothetical protein